MTGCIPASGWKDPPGDFVEEQVKGGNEGAGGPSGEVTGLSVVRPRKRNCSA